MYQATLLLILSALVACTPKTPYEGVHVHSLLDANIPHLDPIHSTNKYSSTVNSAIFEGLFHYHYLKRPLQIEPSLAATLPKISKDKKTYRIKIKKRVFFQDNLAFANGQGRELEASDFIYSWKRLADPQNKALGWWVFDGLIVGLNQWRADLRKGKADYDTPVSGLMALDKHTLEITLKHPSHHFLHRLAMPITMVVAKEVVNKYGSKIANHPVGTGPFVLKQWIRNSKVELIKNPTYRRALYPSESSEETQDLLKDAGKTLPLADKVTIHIFRESQPIWLSFLNGALDHGVLPKENTDQLLTDKQEVKEEYAQKGIRVLTQARPDVTFISFNMEHPILGKHKKLRQALAHALDKKVILETFYNNRGIVAQGPIPPHIDGYVADYTNPHSFDKKKAKKLLREAGFPNGKGLPTFEYHMPNVSTWARQFADFVKAQWADIGVELRLVSNTWPQFDKKLKSKDAAIFDMAWMADYPDGENFLQLYYSQNISPGPNSANFINRGYDSLYQKSLLLPPGRERNKLFSKMVEFINEVVPSIFLVHRVFKLPYHAWLENYNESPLIYDYHKYLTIDQGKKDEFLKKLK